MHPFDERALGLLVWWAFLTILCTVVALVVARCEPQVALLVGANVALLFSLLLIEWKRWLSDDRIARTSAWRLLSAAERPAGPGGRRWARNILEDLALRFAKAASLLAIVLSGMVLITSGE